MPAKARVRFPSFAPGIGSDAANSVKTITLNYNEFQLNFLTVSHSLLLKTYLSSIHTFLKVYLMSHLYKNNTGSGVLYCMQFNEVACILKHY